tara:strand:+ start:1219 stop:1653 length:435 start_codon:yes stop_codon:yes gene_type:complete
MDQIEQLKIFIVDDDLFYQNIIEHYINGLGYTDVKKFNDGVSTLECINENPDVVFLDCIMETLTGYEVLKKIKRFNPNIHVVMVSSQEEIKTAVDTLKHGAFDYIQKSELNEKNVKQILQKIVTVRNLLKKSNNSFFKQLFQLF